jgi:PAS domain-containing protein
MNDIDKTKAELIAELNELRNKHIAEHSKTEPSADRASPFYAAQQISPDGFTVLRPVRDNHGRVVDFTWVYENPAVARMNGTDPDDVVGRRLLELFPGHAESQFMQAYKHVVETAEHVVFEDEYKGETITDSTWFRIVVLPAGADIGGH